MNHSHKQFLMEASAAIGILVLLLFFMIPKFMSVQKYGPIGALKCQAQEGNWSWEKDTLVQSSRMERAFLVFTPLIENGVLSCKALVSEGMEGVQLVFGYKNSSEYCIWNIGSQNNTMTRLEYWFNPTSRTNFSAGDVIPAVYPNGAVYTEWVAPQPFQLTRNVWHDIRLEVNSDQFLVEGFIDGQLVLRYNLHSSVSGKMGLCTWWTHAQFKDIQITPVE